MKYENFNAAYPLTGESIDQIAAQIEHFLTSMKTERANLLRIRLSIEEALLRWQDHFGVNAAVKLELGVKWRRPTITLELKGESYDPFSNSENDLGIWANSLLGNMGLSPQYSYRQGINLIQLKLHRPRRNPALSLLLSVAAGVLAGVLGDALLPAEIKSRVVHTILDPVQNAFFRILNTAAIPVIFLSVLAAVCGVGSIAAMGKSGKRLIARFLLFSTVVTVISTAIVAPLFHLIFEHTPLSGTQFSSVLDFFLQIIPNDALTPFQIGDSPQLILLALILGNALLVAGRQAEGLVHIVEQADTIGLLIADWVSRLTPIFVALLLILGIWDGSIGLLVGIWKPLAVFLALAIVVLIFFLLYVNVTKKVTVGTLIHKMWKSFWIAFKTSSVDAAYGENQLCCERRLGIGKRLTDYGLPLGLVCYMPIATIATMIFTLYAAQCYGVSTSIIWYIMALFLTVALQAASPPVAGVGLLTYAAIFSRLGIPAGALTIAMVADILFHFATAALDQAMLQLELILEADRLELLDRNMLQS